MSVPAAATADAGLLTADRHTAAPRSAVAAPAPSPGRSSGSWSSCIVVCLCAPWIAPYDPIATSFATVRKAPSAAHWFGTDEIGRDVLSRVVFGARASLLAGVVSVLISLSIGVPRG